MVSLAQGSAADYAGYKHQIGYLQALSDVLEKCKEIERDRYGRRPGDKEGE